MPSGLYGIFHFDVNDKIWRVNIKILSVFILHFLITDRPLFTFTIICITLRLLTHCIIVFVMHLFWYWSSQSFALLYCIADIAFLVTSSKKCSHRSIL